MPFYFHNIILFWNVILFYYNILQQYNDYSISSVATDIQVL